MYSNKVAEHCDYSMRSEWEKSFDEPIWKRGNFDFSDSPWNPENYPKDKRRSHRKAPESKTHFISFWVDDEEKCERVKRSFEVYECDWLMCSRIEKESRFYIEGVVRYHIAKSKRWVLRTMQDIVPNGLLVSRMLYNDWERWYESYKELVWYERGERPKAWHQVERKYCKRKQREEEETEAMKKVKESYEKMVACQCKDPMGAGCGCRELDYRKMVRVLLRGPNESEGEIDEVDLR